MCDSVNGRSIQRCELQLATLYKSGVNFRGDLLLNFLQYLVCGSLFSARRDRASSTRLAVFVAHSFADASKLAARLK